MKIAVMGAGGIGAYLGAMLARNGEDVTLICRGANLEAIRENGLRVMYRGEGYAVANVRAIDRPEDVGPVDVILQCVKLYDLESSSRQMLPMVGPGTMVVPTQNGVTAHVEIAAVVGPGHVVGGSVFLSSFMVSPGVVERKSPVDVLTFGELDGALSPRVSAFRDVGIAAGYQAVVPENIVSELWKKFVMLGGTAALCCLSRQSVGVICRDERLCALMVRAMREVEALAQAKGIDVGADVIEKALAFNRAAKFEAKVSMLEDLEAGRRLELDWTSGYISREGVRLGVPTPVHDIVYACVSPYANGSGGRRQLLPAQGCSQEMNL